VDITLEQRDNRRRLLVFVGVALDVGVDGDDGLEALHTRRVNGRQMFGHELWVEKAHQLADQIQLLTVARRR
jgi:hypothetical protein